MSRDDPGHAPMRRYEYSTCTAWIAAHVTTLVTLLHIWIRSCPIHGPIFPVKPRDSRSSGIKPERLWGCTPPPHHWPPPPPCTAAPWGRPEDIYLSALKPYWGVGARGVGVCVTYGDSMILAARIFSQSAPSSLHNPLPLPGGSPLHIFASWPILPG